MLTKHKLLKDKNIS